MLLVVTIIKLGVIKVLSVTTPLKVPPCLLLSIFVFYFYYVYCSLFTTHNVLDGVLILLCKQ